jgi:hypothetical protein
MIRKVKLTKVFHTDKDNAGNPLIGNFGPYYKIGLATEEFPTKYIIGFSATKTLWKSGDEVEINLEEKGENLSFKFVKKEDAFLDNIQSLNRDVANLTKTVADLTHRLALIESQIIIK